MNVYVFHFHQITNSSTILGLIDQRFVSGNTLGLHNRGNVLILETILVLKRIIMKLPSDY